MAVASLVTTVVGSYPQPDWLIDRQQLQKRLPPRAVARELWRVPGEFLEQAQDDATILAVRAMDARGSMSSRMARSVVRVFEPLRECALWH